MLVSIIVALDEKNAIGKDNTLLWHLPNDLKFFKSLTSGHHILMGRKTYESIRKPLPNRENLVVSKDRNLLIEGCKVFDSVSSAISFAKENGESELFIIGGAQIYNLALPYANKLYLTQVKSAFEADTFFPEIDFSKWQKIKETYFEKDEKNAFSHSFVELIKKS